MKTSEIDKRTHINILHSYYCHLNNYFIHLYYCILFIPLCFFQVIEWKSNRDEQSDFKSDKRFDGHTVHLPTE